MLLFNVLQFHLKNYLKDLFCGRSSCNQLSLILFGKGFMILFLLSYFNPQLRTCLLILEREGRDKERERNINVREKHWLVAFSVCPDWGMNPKPRHVPWLEIKPKIFWLAEQHPTNWTTPAMTPLAALGHLCRVHYSHFLSVLWNISPHPLLACKVSVEKGTNSL